MPGERPAFSAAPLTAKRISRLPSRQKRAEAVASGDSRRLSTAKRGSQSESTRRIVPFHFESSRLTPATAQQLQAPAGSSNQPARQGRVARQPADPPAGHGGAAGGGTLAPAAALQQETRTSGLFRGQLQAAGGDRIDAGHLAGHASQFMALETLFQSPEQVFRAASSGSEQAARRYTRQCGCRGIKIVGAADPEECSRMPCEQAGAQSKKKARRHPLVPFLPGWPELMQPGEPQAAAGQAAIDLFHPEGQGGGRAVMPPFSFEALDVFTKLVQISGSSRTHG